MCYSASEDWVTNYMTLNELMCSAWPSLLSNNWHYNISWVPVTGEEFDDQMVKNSECTQKYTEWVCICS